MNNINLAVGSEVTVATKCDLHKRKGKVVAHLHIPRDNFGIVITHESFGMPVEGGITQLFNREGKSQNGAVKVVPTVEHYRQYVTTNDVIPEWLEVTEADSVYGDYNNILGILDADFNAETEELSNVRYTTLEK